MKAQLEIIDECRRQSFRFKIEDDVWPVWHFHPEIDLLYFANDSGRYIVGDFIGELQPDTLLVIGPNLPHAFHANERPRVKGEEAVYVAQFSEESLGQELLIKSEMLAVKKFLDQAQYGLLIKGEKLPLIKQQMQNMQQQTAATQLASLIILLDTLAHTEPEERQQLASSGYSPSLQI